MLSLESDTVTFTHAFCVFAPLQETSTPIRKLLVKLQELVLLLLPLLLSLFTCGLELQRVCHCCPRERTTTSHVPSVLSVRFLLFNSLFSPHKHTVSAKLFGSVPAGGEIQLCVFFSSKYQNSLLLIFSRIRRIWESRKSSGFYLRTHLCLKESSIMHVSGGHSALGVTSPPRLFLIGSQNRTRSPRHAHSPRESKSTLFFTRKYLKMSILAARSEENWCCAVSVSVYTERKRHFFCCCCDKWNGFASVALNPTYTFCSLVS